MNLDTFYWTLFSYFLTALQSLVEHAHEFILALLGTFVGAYAAFRLERSAKHRERLDARAAEGNLALFTLWLMWEIMNECKKDVVEKAPKGDGRWLNMPITPHEQHGDLAFDPSKLHFLFECKDKNILAQLFLEQRRFYKAIALINRRSDLMLKVIWPRLSAARIEREKQCDENLIKSVIGENNVIEAQVLESSLTQQVPHNVTSFKETFQKLREQLREILPGMKFIKVEWGDSIDGENRQATS